jgi:hypothetical protein
VLPATIRVTLQKNKIGASMRKKPVDEDLDDVVELQPAAEHLLGSKIQRNLCGVYITTKRPSGRPMMKEVEITATTKDQDQSVVEKGKTTRPCWKIDIHKLWKAIDLNGTKIENIVNRYSVSASVKSEHLCSLLKAGKMLSELNTARNERLALAQEMYEKWDSEVIPGLEAAFPSFFENQIKDRLPKKDTLINRFDVYWLIRPLTPMDGNQLDLSALSEADAREVITRNAEFVNNLAKQRLTTIFDEAFNEVVKLCDDINTGEYAFGNRKEGAVTEILNMLEKVTNFSDFTNEDVIERVRSAHQTISRYSVTQINGSKMVQGTIKSAMAPLGAALKELSAGVIVKTRVNKAVNI